MMRADAEAFSARSRFKLWRRPAIHLDTLRPALAASILTQRRVVSSMLIVTFCTSRIT